MTSQRINKKTPKRSVTKEEIMSAITMCAKRLGRVPSLTELQRTSKVTEKAIRKHFGKYSWALRECKLRTEGDSRKADMPDFVSRLGYGSKTAKEGPQRAGIRPPW